jgi:hypothetical protein
MAGLRGQTLVHVLHIYKTGGTALKHALQDATSGNGHLVLSHKHSVTMDCIPIGQKVVFFLRDPASRFVSAYYDRRRLGRPRYDTPWSAQEARMFARFDTPNALAEALCSRTDRAAAREGMASIGRITQPVSGWLGSAESLLARRDDILMVGQQETLSSDFERLKLRLGLPETLELPSSAVEAHFGEKASTYLSPAALGALREWFAADYTYLDTLRRAGLLEDMTAEDAEPGIHERQARRLARH